MKARGNKKRQATTKTTAISAWLSQLHLTQSFGWLLLLWLIAVGIYWHQQPPQFPIHKVTLQGRLQYASTKLIDKSINEAVNAGFFGLDVTALKAKLLAIPAIEKVKLRRIWPDTLQVQIEEYQPLAIWNKTQLISAQGQLFPIVSGKITHLPQLQGPQEQALMVVRHYQQLQNIIAPSGLSIRQLELASRGAWQIMVAPDLLVILGTTDLPSRLTRFVNAYEKGLKTQVGKVAYIDMRYSSGMAVGWKSG
jgi:cell division protein FtsQ